MDERAAHHPGLMLIEFQLRGVIGGDVLQQAGDCIEAHPATTVDIGPAHRARTAEDPSHRRDREQFLGPVGSANRGLGGGHSDDATGHRSEYFA